MAILALTGVRQRAPRSPGQGLVTAVADEAEPLLELRGAMVSVKDWAEEQNRQGRTVRYGKGGRPRLYVANPGTPYKSG